MRGTLGNVVIAFVLLSPVAHAADDGRTIAGAGANSCGKLIDAQRYEDEPGRVDLTPEFSPGRE
jgi:hypothetical protein